MNTYTPNYGQSIKARLLNLAKQKKYWESIKD